VKASTDAVCAFNAVMSVVTPESPDPSPINDPLNEPVKLTSALLDYIKFASFVSWDIDDPDTIIFFPGCH